MIERYTRPEMARVWDPESRIRRMLEVEIAFLEALAKDKSVPASELKHLKALLGRPWGEEVKKKEAKSAHDVVALIQAVAEALKGKAPALTRYLHYGLTSSDVLDTALALQLVEAAQLLERGWKKVERLIRSLALRHEETWMAGRTHGVHAEPITFGLKLAGYHAEARRNLARLARAREHVAYGKLSGAVGSFAHFSPSLEEKALRSLALKPEPISTQVVPRDRHAEYFGALALSACAVERFAVEIRHLQRTEVLELEEPFGEGQKGSSAMPHKRNPVLSENLCGLARLVRSYHAAALEDVALWHERDISHSSVERVAFPDATILLDFMLDRLASVLKGLKVHPERMKANLESSRGLVFSQKVLLKLIDKGLNRLKAYDVVQRSAMKTWKTGRDFQAVLAADPELARHLDAEELKACLDLGSYRASIKALFRREGLR